MSRTVVGLLLIGLGAGAFAQDDVATIMEELRSEDAAMRKAAGGKAAQIGAPLVASLLEMYAEGTSLAESVAEGVLMDIVARATAPGARQASSLPADWEPFLRSSEPSERARTAVAYA
ncbi:MAG: hypothetical protein ACE5JM_16720, partial [Armatimonadota bacterium]